MNQKELSELRTAYKKEEQNGTFVINKIASYYVSSDKEVVYSNVENYGIIAEDRCTYFNLSFLSALKGKIGKANKEYRLTDQSKRDIFDSLLCSRLDEKDTLDNYVNNIIDNYDYVSNYVIFIGYYTYTVLEGHKDALEPDDTSDEYDYNFIITTICPIEVTNDGFIYENVDNKGFIADSALKQSVQTPMNGLLYPIFSDRTPDTNSVLVFDKSPKKPNVSIVERVCGSSFTYSNDTQKATFNTMITNVLGSDVDYELVTDINQTLVEKLDVQKLNTEPATLGKDELVGLLIDAGVNPDNKEYLEKAYEKSFGETKLDTSALIDNTNKIQTSDFTITFPNAVSGQLKTTVVNGKNCIVIPIDDVMNINGIDVKH